MSAIQYFQDYMPGNVCFGCGTRNEKGLQIRSYWQDEIAVCDWRPQAHHQGWAELTCGGVIATLIDCHCIATAMATAIRNEKRALGSEPHYLFATGSLNVKFLKPTLNDRLIRLEANVTEVKWDKKYSVACDVFSEGTKTAEGEVIALRVYRSDRPDEASPVFRPR